MRFLLLNQFYPPDPAPTGRYLHDVAQALAARGHEVKVFCSSRSYDGTTKYPRRESRDGVEIIRLLACGFGRRGFVGRLIDYASFYSSLSMALAFSAWRPDVILSLTTPPYIGLLGKMAACKSRCRHAQWIMDLYPDVLFAHGMARENGLLPRFLRRLTRFQIRGAQPVLALGEKMAKKVAAYTDRAPVFTMPLWSSAALAPWPENKPNSLREKRGWNDLVLLYSGNMGLGHRFGEFLEAAKRLGQHGPRWVFAGGGKRRAEIQAFAAANPSARIEMLDYAPDDQLQEHLCSADVHLASLDSAWQGMIVPSKLQGSFAVGRPVLYVGGRQCETAAWIQESGGGWVVDENDIEGLLTIIQHGLDPQERRQRAQAGLNFARNRFQTSANCTQIARWLEGEIS